MDGAKFSIRFFTGVLIVAGALLVIIAIHDYHAQQAVDNLKERYLQIEQYRSQIIHTDEMMTMSARMAAATGDTRWESRYLEDKPKLSEAIKRAMAVLPEIYRKETDRSSIGKIQLLALEEKAFALVHEGKDKEAMGILFGEQYEAQKKKYAQAIENLNILLKKLMMALKPERNLPPLNLISLFWISICLHWMGIKCTLIFVKIIKIKIPRF